MALLYCLISSILKLLSYIFFPFWRTITSEGRVKPTYCFILTENGNIFSYVSSHTRNNWFGKINVSIKISDPFAGHFCWFHTFVGSLDPVMCSPIGSSDFYALDLFPLCTCLCSWLKQPWLWLTHFGEIKFNYCHHYRPRRPRLGSRDHCA